jgi:hypothetical protein
VILKPPSLPTPSGELLNCWQGAEELLLHPI